MLSCLYMYYVSSFMERAIRSIRYKELNSECLGVELVEGEGWLGGIKPMLERGWAEHVN